MSFIVDEFVDVVGLGGVDGAVTAFCVEYDDVESESDEFGEWSEWPMAS